MFCYPHGWFDKSAYGSVSIVSEDTPSPLTLSPTGIWMGVNRFPAAPEEMCLMANMAGTVVSQKTIQVSGFPASYAYVNYEGASIVVNVPDRGRCYSITFINGSVSGRDSNAPLVDRILATVVLY